MCSKRSQDGFSEKVKFTCKATTETLIHTRILSCLEEREKNALNISLPLLYVMHMTRDLIPDWASLTVDVVQPSLRLPALQHWGWSV